MNKEKENRIKSELFNYECWWTEDPEEVIGLLSGEGITTEEVLIVFNKYRTSQ